MKQVSNTHRYVREQRADSWGEQKLYSVHSAHSSHRRVFETGDAWMIHPCRTWPQRCFMKAYQETLTWLVLGTARLMMLSTLEEESRDERKVLFHANWRRGLGKLRPREENSLATGEIFLAFSFDTALASP